MAELVGLNAQTPNVMGKLSDLLGIQQQQAELAGAQQSLRQRQALARRGLVLGDEGAQGRAHAAPTSTPARKMARTRKV